MEVVLAVGGEEGPTATRTGAERGKEAAGDPDASRTTKKSREDKNSTKAPHLFTAAHWVCQMSNERVH